MLTMFSKQDASSFVVVVVVVDVVVVVVVVVAAAAAAVVVVVVVVAVAIFCYQPQTDFASPWASTRQEQQTYFCRSRSGSSRD